MVLRYRSERLRAMWSYAYALPLLLGWLDESQARDASVHARPIPVPFPPHFRPISPC